MTESDHTDTFGLIEGLTYGQQDHRLALPRYHGQPDDVLDIIDNIASGRAACDDLDQAMDIISRSIENRIFNTSINSAFSDFGHMNRIRLEKKLLEKIKQALNDFCGEDQRSKQRCSPPKPLSSIKLSRQEAIELQRKFAIRVEEKKDANETLLDIARNEKCWKEEERKEWNNHPNRCARGDIPQSYLYRVPANRIEYDDIPWAEIKTGLYVGAGVAIIIFAPEILPLVPIGARIATTFLPKLSSLMPKIKIPK